MEKWVIGCALLVALFLTSPLWLLLASVLLGILFH